VDECKPLATDSSETYSTCFETGGGGGGIIGNTMAYYASTVGGALQVDPKLTPC